MASLNCIEEFLNIEIGDKRLHQGKKKQNKNRYYLYRNRYYIVSMPNDKWGIMSDNEQTRELLTNHIWYCDNGYFKTSVNRRTSGYHRMLMNPNDDMCIDHINRRRYDNRVENLRIVTHKENMHNKSIYSSNTSSCPGIGFRTKDGIDSWRCFINNNNGRRIERSFSCLLYGHRASEFALNQRHVWERDFGYTLE
jgi:HNH endonuclease